MEYQRNQWMLTAIRHSVLVMGQTESGGGGLVEKTWFKLAWIKRISNSSCNSPWLFATCHYNSYNHRKSHSSNMHFDWLFRFYLFQYSKLFVVWETFPWAMHRAHLRKLKWCAVIVRRFFIHNIRTSGAHTEIEKEKEKKKRESERVWSELQFNVRITFIVNAISARKWESKLWCTTVNNTLNPHRYGC